MEKLIKTLLFVAGGMLGASWVSRQTWAQDYLSKVPGGTPVATGLALYFGPKFIGIKGEFRKGLKLAAVGALAPVVATEASKLLPSGSVGETMSTKVSKVTYLPSTYRKDAYYAASRDISTRGKSFA